VAAQEHGWAPSSILNPSYNMSLHGVEDKYVCVVWSDFWDEAWPQVGG